ncbi:sulfotransferase [Zhouia amylolytica]|uniref:Uncharacterized protein n=1 Tax=Zhouia amylolytica AD3 TaxID=1286632 RepID=W2UP79_9FLAO|nr:sulfotransferase [Zhouia amylolytica]ETN95788.1 hypothetical protein P278_15100 [Zhouia amylolytica AD3]
MRGKQKQLPDFLIVGVARCGTTSLFHYLNQHPKIGFPVKKEPKYFSSLHINFPQKGIGDSTVDNKIVKDLNTYTNLFNGLKDFPLLGEASSDYFYYHKNTIPEIKRTLGDVPIIISIRNPIERSFSAYNNLVRDGRENLSFSLALEKEDERSSAGWDWMWAYTQGSLYAEGIKAFQENFSKVKVVLFDEIQENPAKVLNDIEQFLDIEAYNDYDTSVKYSPSGSPKNKLIKLISSRNSKVINGVRNSVMNIIPRSVLEKIAKGFYAKDDLDNMLKKQLNEIFKEDIEKTEVLIGKSLNSWKK